MNDGVTYKEIDDLKKEYHRLRLEAMSTGNEEKVIQYTGALVALKNLYPGDED